MWLDRLAAHLPTSRRGGLVRRLRHAWLTVALLLVAATPARSTSIIAPTFDDLVARADQVVLARVVDRRSLWMTSRSGRAIVTDVTLSIERTLKGPVYTQRSLEFLGGAVGDDMLEVDGMPQFRVGDRDVLFIRDSGRPASPLIGFMYGRFRVVRDAVGGGQTIRTHDGRPLASLADVGNPRPPAIIAPPRVVSLDDFLQAIDTAVRLLERRP
jgi:hypothetical protein